MKIRLTKIVILFIMLTLLVGCSDNSDSSKTERALCGVENCNNLVIKYDYGHGVCSYGKYCEEHTCKEDGCDEMVQDDGDYCSVHIKKQIQLTESELKQVRKVVDDYIKQLMEKQSNILAVNIINDNPETTTLYIKYSCNVVRTDSNTNLATLYLYVTSDGEFKVNRLEYDK